MLEPGTTQQTPYFGPNKLLNFARPTTPGSVEALGRRVRPDGQATKTGACQQTAVGLLEIWELTKKLPNSLNGKTLFKLSSDRKF